MTKLAALFLFLLMAACQKSQPQSELPKAPVYSATPRAIDINGARILEASGMTYSKNIDGHLWVNQDSGNPPMLYLLNGNGNISDSLNIAGLTNRDWEDMTSGKGPADGVNYLYIGEIGDNDAKYAEYFIYRFPEPQTGENNISSYDQIGFTYEDGSRDAEALLIDDQSKDIYVITKREARSRVYKISYPQTIGSGNQARFLFELPFSGVVSAASSPDGKEIILKTYTQLYYYQKQGTASIADVLQNNSPATLSYQLEPQGEAVSFTATNSGFYTLSEEAMGIVPKLYFYEKK